VEFKENLLVPGLASSPQVPAIKSIFNAVVYSGTAWAA